MIVLSKNPRSFYDKGDSELERGDLWSIITHNGERPGAVDMLDFDKNIQKTYAYSLNLTQGKIDAHPDSIKVTKKLFFLNSEIVFFLGFNCFGSNR